MKHTKSATNRQHFFQFILLGFATVMLTASAVAATAEGEKNPAVASVEQMGEAFAQVAEQVTPVVVSVLSEKTTTMSRNPLFENPPDNWPFGDWFKDFPFRSPDDRGGSGRQGQSPRQNQPKFRQQGLGSGIIISADGYILTNHHVAGNADKLKVILAGNDRKQYEAKLVGSDPKSDVAIIKIDAKNLPFAKLGSSDEIKVGQWALAVGAPFGLTHTVTAGIISAKGRSNVGVADYEDMIQTDAAINPGNSGGPLVNLKGEVIGMNTAIASNSGAYEGIGFAIPVNMIKQLLPTLKSGSKIARGYLGVSIQDVTEELAEKFDNKETRGALVSEIQPNSPALKAGFEVGDIITKLNAKPIETSNQLRNTVAAIKPGTEVMFTVLRKGAEKEIRLKLGELPSEAVASVTPEDSGFGVTVQTLTPQLAKELGYKDEQGAVVTAVESGSVAEMAGVSEGDLVLEVNRQKIRSAEDFKTAIGKSPTNVLLLLKNNQGTRFVVIKTD